LKTLLQFYQYTFYWGYEWSLRKYGPNQAPEITGLGILTLCLYLNLFAVLLLSGWLLQLTAVPMSLPKWQVALFLFAFAVPHYWYLLYSKRYRAIAAKFDAWDAERRWYMNRRVIGYIFLSFLGLAIAAYCVKNYPNPLGLLW
jgi:hypothetical protein